MLSPLATISDRQIRYLARDIVDPADFDNEESYRDALDTTIGAIGSEVRSEVLANPDRHGLCRICAAEGEAVASVANGLCLECGS